jgi:integrase
MRPEQQQLAKELLIQTMKGARCADLGLRRGLSNTQVRRLCLEAVGLAAAAGRMDFAAAADLKSLKRLRLLHAQRVVDALEDFEPKPGAAAGELAEDGIAAGLERLRSRSRRPQRDVAMLCTLLATGMRPVEIVRLTVADCLMQRGTLRQEVVVRAEVAVREVARTVYFASERLVAALEAYLAERVEMARTSGRLTPSYRGLSGSAPLFLTDRGAPFKVHPRPGGGTPLSPRAFEVFARIFVDAGWPGLSSGDVRRQLRVRLIEQHARSDDVALMLDCRTGLRRPRARTSVRPLPAVAMEVL